MIPKALDWLNAGGWKPVAIVLLTVLPSVFLSLANAVTKHYSNYSGLARFFLFVAEFFSVLASKDAPGTLKLPLTIGDPPLSRRRDDDDQKRPPSPPAALTLVCFAAMLAACAHGSDGVRQSCTGTNSTLASGYRSYAIWYRGDQTAIRETAERDRAAARRVLASHEPIAERVLTTLDEGKASAEAICSDDTFEAIDAGQRKDTAELIAQLAKVAANVSAAVAIIVAKEQP